MELMKKAVNSISMIFVFLILLFCHASSVIAQIYISSGKKAVGPVLQVTPLKIDLGNIEKNTSRDFYISVKNTGKGELNWEIVSDSTWLVPKDDTSLDAYNQWLKTMDRGTTLSTGKSDSYEDWKAERKHLPEALFKREKTKIYFTAYTIDLPEGNYESSIIVRSNGGECKVDVSMNVVSLQSISINPVSITIRAGQRRTFRAIGIWSDGSRTNLSSTMEGQWVISDPSIGSFLYNKPVFVAEKTGQMEIRKIRGDLTSNTAVVNIEEFISEPVLFISPREIKLGDIGPGESSRGAFSLKNVGSETLKWSTNGPAGWISPEETELNGILGKSPRYIRIYVESLIGRDEEPNPYREVYPVKIKLETMSGSVTYNKSLPLGTYREMIKLYSNGGTRHVFFNFKVSRVGSRPRLAVDPLGIDLGIVEAGKKLIKKIKINNSGKGILKWKARLRKNRKRFTGITFPGGRYLSLFNKNILNKEMYRIPDHLKDSVFISGRWLEDNGYPSSDGKSNSLKKTFSGTGIAVFVWRDVEGGIIKAFIDDHFAGKIDCNSEKRARAEFIVAEDLREGPHILNLICSRGNVVIEGMRIYGDDLMKGGKNWIQIYPGNGTTTKETDYANVIINTGNLKSGNYGENIIFSSNGGSEIVEVSFKVSDSKSPNIINIYRYMKGLDCLFTASPESEAPDILQSYKNGKIAFKLYRRGTRGTTEFYRWYNPSKMTHFYSYDRSGGGKSLRGYIFEGSVGNIATSRLSKTRELYRWYNPATGTHSYSTNLKGENYTDNGYKYDGIAGYVR
jgi:hypothetical protein